MSGLEYRAAAADDALVRLLHKLELLESDELPPGFSSPERRPIAHFAACGLFNEEHAIDLVAQELSIEAFPLSVANEEDVLGMFDQLPVRNISVARWNSYLAVPVRIEAGGLVVAFANPLDHDTLQMLEFDLDCAVIVAVDRESLLRTVLIRKLHDPSSLDLDDILKDAVPSKSAQVDGFAVYDETSLGGDSIDAAPVVRLVNKIFAMALVRGASDIHITPERDFADVRVRTDGIMRPLLQIPNGFKVAVISRIKLLSGMDIAERRRPQDGRLRVKGESGCRDLRLSTVPTAYGENLVVRVLSSDQSILSLPSLGVPPHVLPHFERALGASSRVVLISGPTGSGKTSTLYAGLMHLKNGERNIITIEDPVEYRIAGVTQIQVNTKLGISFASGLRSVLRQDPDVVMVGEIRDPETAATAMQVAQTGHLVLSTIHTNTASAAVVRLLDLEVPGYSIASALGAVMAQRLVRVLCADCCEDIRDAEKKRCESLSIDPEGLKEAVGCSACDHTGFRGRIGIYSFLGVNEAVREAIRQGQSGVVIEECAREAGFTTLEEAGLEVVRAGATSLQELERILGLLDRGTSERKVYHSVRPDIPVGAPAEQPRTIGRRQVLLVEDDEDTRLILQLVLESELYQVELAVNGKEALEKIYNSPPDIVVCDVMMPVMDGQQLVERLKQDQRTRTIPVLMLTANDSDENELKLMKMGADDFLGKTKSSAILLARINRLMNGA